MLGKACLAQILDRLPSERLAIAFSGGGDSTALVHMCRGLRPKPLVLIVDHALRAGSAAEARQAQKFAQGLGLETDLLRWDHDNPKTGLQEKARRGRYGLMGAKCRQAGIRYLLTGHTQNDQAETLLMRYEKGTGWRGAAGMAEYTYAPVWPELSKITLIRPLLDVSRQSLRDYNQYHELGWTEDPSNKNEIFERVRTRQYLAPRPGRARQLLHTAKDLRQGLNAETARVKRQINDYVTIDENGIASVSGPLSKRAWQYLLLAAGGADKAASMAKLDRVQEIAADVKHNGTTLGGARIRRHGKDLLVGPDPGPYVGRSNILPMADVRLNAGEHIIWGGRFEAKAKDSAVMIRTIENLSRAAETVVEVREVRTLIRDAPSGKKRFNPTMPYIFDENGDLLSSIFENRDAGYFSSLVENRLQGFLRIKNQ